MPFGPLERQPPENAYESGIDFSVDRERRRRRPGVRERLEHPRGTRRASTCASRMRSSARRIVVSVPARTRCGDRTVKPTLLTV